MTSKLTWERKGESFSYIITEEDRLWLLRAVNFEGAPQRAVAWTLIQRFAWIFPTYSTLSDFIQAYAQPVNPRWFPDGDLFLKRVQKKRLVGTALQYEKVRAEKRIEYASTPISELGKYAGIVDLILSGRDKSPIPSSVHYSMSLARPTESNDKAKERAVRVGAQRSMGPVCDAKCGYGVRINWFFAAGGSHRVDLKLRITENVPNV